MQCSKKLQNLSVYNFKGSRQTSLSQKGSKVDPLGEGRNPPEEIKGWKAKKAWQEPESRTPGKCHISGDKLHVIAKTKRRKITIWASEDSDGDLFRLASRTAEEKAESNKKNENLKDS